MSLTEHDHEDTCRALRKADRGKNICFETVTAYEKRRTSHWQTSRDGELGLRLVEHTETGNASSRHPTLHPAIAPIPAQKTYKKW